MFRGKISDRVPSIQINYFEIMVALIFTSLFNTRSHVSKGHIIGEVEYKKKQQENIQRVSRIAAYLNSA